jgi:hypothetical protein
MHDSWTERGDVVTPFPSAKMAITVSESASPSFLFNAGVRRFDKDVHRVIHQQLAESGVEA